MRWYEDLEAGDVHACGPRTVTESEILEFAAAYDPQAFHLDREVAEASMFGGLSASGWHTAAVCMRMLVDGFFEDVAIAGALGVDDLRWWQPVYAGDAIAIETTVADREVWDDERGRVRFDLEATNQDDETVHTRSDLVLVERAD